MKGIIAVLLGVLLLGCAHKPPTIAHTHVGHAITGFEHTPGQEGLFVVAEARGREVLEDAEAAASAGENLAAIKAATANLVDVTVSEDFGMIDAMKKAESHVTFAATSADASENIRSGAKIFTAYSEAILERCDTMVLLGGDLESTRSAEDATRYARAIVALARANVYGEDLDGDGMAGSSQGEWGLEQLRDELDAMVAREDPPYVTVDRWFLFALFQLPDGTWAFPKWGKSGGGGYK